MGIVYMTGGGGSSSGSDDCTALPGDLIAGKTAILNGSNDEPITGTLKLTGDATASDVVSSKTFYNNNAKSKITGTLTNRGSMTNAVSIGNNAKLYVRIPQGAYKTNASAGYPEIVVPYESVRNAIGMTDASKLLSGTSWLGLSGTMPNRGNAQTAGGWGEGTDYYAMNNIPSGYYYGNNDGWSPEIRLSKDKVRAGLGIDGGKIVRGYSIAGVNGKAPKIVQLNQVLFDGNISFSGDSYSGDTGVGTLVGTISPTDYPYVLLHITNMNYADNGSDAWYAAGTDSVRLVGLHLQYINYWVGIVLKRNQKGEIRFEGMQGNRSGTYRIKIKAVVGVNGAALTMWN